MTEASEASATTIAISLDAVQREISQFDRIGAGLAELEAAHPKNVVYDVTAPAGMESAIVARRAWREPRIAVEKARKAAKAPVLDLGRRIDSFAGSLEEKLRAGEDHYDAQIQAEEERRERIRQERLQAEAEKIAAIRRRIVDLFAPPLGMPGLRLSVADLTKLRDRVEAEPVDDSFGDLKIEAQETKVLTLEALGVRIAEQRSIEEREAALAAERAVFAEEQRQETARRAAARAEQDARIEAEQRQRDAIRAADEESLRLAREETARQQAAIEARAAELSRREAEATERERSAQAAERAAQDEELRRQAAEAEAALRRAHERENQVSQAAPEMHSLLSDWREFDLQHASGPTAKIMFDALRARRDRILSDLRVGDAQADLSTRPEETRA